MVSMMFSGCSSAHRYANLSSTVIGCDPEIIAINHEPFIPIGAQNWQADCRGKRYICSYQSTTGVTCIEMINPFEIKSKKNEEIKK